jgi:hypothetical protein
MLGLLTTGATGRDGGGGERSTGRRAGGADTTVSNDDAVVDTATAHPSSTSLASLCGVSLDPLASLAEQASVFEEHHSVSESPEEILALVRARAAAAPNHPDDCAALIEHHAVARSGCRPGVRIYPWMGCDFAEERAPG